MELYAKIEAILFFKAEPVSVGHLVSILKSNEADIEEALGTLSENLSDRGVRLVRNDDSVLLVTAPEASKYVEQALKDELQRNLGKAGLETLTIVLYNSPITRAEIDYIRGVNSTYMLRHLLVRGLVEKSINPNDKRSYIYKPTFELLSYMGLERIEDLPEFEQLKAEMNAFKEGEEDSKVLENEGGA